MEGMNWGRAALVAGWLAVTLCGTARAQDAELLKLPHDTYADGVAGFKDIPYQILQGYHPQTADVYVPTSGKGPYPAVVFVHGGGWGVGSPRMMDTVPMLTALAARGFVVVGINYRFHGEAKFPAQIQDTKAAIRWLRSNAAQYRVDPERIGIWGGSAGGYLAALAGTSCGVAALEPAAAAPSAPQGAPRGAPPGMDSVNSDPKQSDCVQAVVDWYGPVDFAVMDKQSLPNSMQHDAPNGAESQLLGCALPQCSKALLAQSNPITYIDRNDPPFLIVHGDNDHGVPSGQSVELNQALLAAGVSSQLVVVKGADHMFAGAGDAKVQELKQDAYDFFTKTLGAK